GRFSTPFPRARRSSRRTSKTETASSSTRSTASSIAPKRACSKIGAVAVNGSLRRLLSAIGFFITLVVVGSVGYLLLGRGRWTYADCVYMTIITISTVGFYELHDLAQIPGARELTVALIVSGVGALTYLQSNVTALLVEGAIGQALRRNRMRK